MRERGSFALREDVADLSRAIDAPFAQVEEIEKTSISRHAEVLHNLSVIQNAISPSGSGDAVILSALDDLRRKINDPDNVVNWLGSSHAMLRDLLAERESAANHNSASASRD